MAMRRGRPPRLFHWQAQSRRIAVEVPAEPAIMTHLSPTGHPAPPGPRSRTGRREDVFGSLGVANIRTFVDPHAVMAAMQTEAMSEAMAHDGVLPETLVILVEA